MSSPERPLFAHPAVLVAGAATLVLIAIGVVASLGDGKKPGADKRPDAPLARASDPAAGPTAPDAKAATPTDRPATPYAPTSATAAATAAARALEPSGAGGSTAAPTASRPGDAPAAVIAAAPLPVEVAPAAPDDEVAKLKAMRAEQSRNAMADADRAFEEAAALEKSGDRAGAQQKRAFAEALKKRAESLGAEAR